jgi:hypothetical protein
MNVSIDAFDTRIQRSSCWLQDCRMSNPCPLRNIVVLSFSDNVLLFCLLRSKPPGTFTGAFPGKGWNRETEFFGTSVHPGLRWAACQAMRQSEVQNRRGEPPPCILGPNGFPHWSQRRAWPLSETELSTCCCASILFEDPSAGSLYMYTTLRITLSGSLLSHFLREFHLRQRSRTKLRDGR